MNPTVLITCAINPPPGIKYLNLSDPAQRLITTKCSVYFWASIGIKKLLIVDSTSTSVLDENELETLKITGIDVEQITFQQKDEDIIQKGKGYAEGKLIEFALNHSRILKNETSFFKSTGKVFCRNLPKIINLISSSEVKSIFWSLFEHDKFNTVDTRFFYASIEDCRTILLPIYDSLNETTIGKCIEETLTIYFDQLLIKGRSLRPQLSGFAGGHGKQWEETHLGDIENSFPCWFKK
jgi:hypothetical protein